MENLIYIILLAAGASFIQRTIGFGFGIFIMTVLPFLMPSYSEAVTLSGMLSLTSATVVMVQYIKYVTWKRLLPMFAAFTVFSTIAILMLDRIEGPTMRHQRSNNTVYHIGWSAFSAYDSVVYTEKITTFGRFSARLIINTLII